MDKLELIARFAEIYGEGETRVFSAAGRVNLIGEHIDYNGGKVFPAALDLKCSIAIRPNGTDKLNLAFTTLPNRVTLDINDLGAYKDLDYGDYQAGVAYVLQNAGYDIVGLDMLYDANVPFGSGLSSSAAIEVATAFTFATLSKEKHGDTTPVDLVEMSVLSQKAENEYVGVNCGIMDQFASAMGLKDKAILLDCATLDYEYVDFDLGDYRLVISNCNRPRSLTDSKYNERRAECDEAVALLQKELPDLKFLCELSVDEFNKHSHLLSGKVLDRATHVVSENERVANSVAAMRDGDIITFGKQLTASHKSLKELYEVTSLELDTLAETAITLPGCVGARMTGAGFGGCTIAIVHKDNVDAFVAELGKIYTERTGRVATFYNTFIANGAQEL